uniref:Tubulin--tyrosine ligase-like protein 9 n=1 Tax=Hucho hucho TaxID=62062 RepID=A0A4W5QA37_9TELE
MLPVPGLHAYPAWGVLVMPGMQSAVVQDLVEGRRGRFELYGADFMLGRDLRPWRLEINASPTMVPSMASLHASALLCSWIPSGWCWTDGWTLVPIQGAFSSSTSRRM